MNSSAQTVSLDDLPNFAQSFAKTLKAGERVCLIGDLGSGKTTFLFQVMQALGIQSGNQFSSPTFSLLNQYETAFFPVNHLDLYRLGSYEELIGLDLLAELERADAVSFVEWGDKFSELESRYTRILRFSHLPDDPESRRIEFIRS